VLLTTVVIRLVRGRPTQHFSQYRQIGCYNGFIISRRVNMPAVATNLHYFQRQRDK